MNFAKFLRTPFLQNTSGRQLHIFTVSLKDITQLIANIYLFKFNNRNTRKGVKYVQS